MSLSDCPRCWDTPCSCGYEYGSWSSDRIYQHIAILVRVLTVKESSPLQPIVERIAEASKREGIR